MKMTLNAVTADVVLPEQDANGVIIAQQGGAAGGGRSMLKMVGSSTATIYSKFTFF